jgi:hypothetical protein
MEVKMTEVTWYRPDGNAIYETLDNETVIINLENGRYYSLNPAGSFIWDALMQSSTVHEIADAFARRNHADADTLVTAISQFVNELVGEALVTPVTAATRPTAPDLTAAVNFETPQLVKFTDMEKLIPLDPIHQVGALGWPFQEPQK